MHNPGRNRARPILILKTGSTHAPIRERMGDFEHRVADGLLAGVVITGSHSMVSEREPWSEALVPWLQQAVQAGLPVLGICYGHQLLAQPLNPRSRVGAAEVCPAGPGPSPPHRPAPEA